MSGEESGFTDCFSRFLVAVFSCSHDSGCGEVLMIGRNCFSLDYAENVKRREQLHCLPECDSVLAILNQGILCSGTV